jgi:hypothetical protein
MAKPKLSIDPPACSTCGGRTRLVGLEPHPDKPKADLLTFECTDCGAYEIAELPAGQYAGPLLVEVRD